MSENFPQVDLVDLNTRTVLLTDSTILPITDFFDGDGDDCEPLEAVVCVAGSDEFGWLEIEILPATQRTRLH